MNEELIDKMFQDAVSKGYSEDKNSFISLLNSDDEVFYDMYSRFAQGQMNKDQFRSVITPKKKESSQVGSQKTPPTSGSKPAQSSGKSFAGSLDYLEPKPKFGEIPTAPKVPGTERVVPAQQATKKPETTKRTIVRGEEADQAIVESLKPQQAVSESTKPVVTPPAPMTVEEGELQKVIEKEKGKQPEFIDFQDIEKLYSDPENETSKYYEMFLQNAKNSQKGDIEYGKRLRDAYAADFVDPEFENEYRISSDIDNLNQKMKSELASLSEKVKTDPNAANLFESKKNEYFALISKKQNELDAAREQTNQGYKNRIAEIDKLFQTGEAALREEGLLDEKKELQRRMGIIELAKNPGSLKDNIGQVQYNKLPGATAQDKLINYLNSRLTAYDRFYNANKDADSLPQEMRNKVKDSYSKLQGELKDLYYLTSLKRFVNPEDRPGFWEATGEKFAKEFLAGGLDFTDNAQMHSENLQTIAKNAGISFSDKDKSYIETTAAPADAYSPEWWGDNFGSTLGFGANIAITAPFGNASLKVGEGIVKATPMFRKIAEYGLKRYSKLGSTGQKITNTIFNSLDEGYNFEMANQLIYDGESDELTFLTGVGGAIAAAPVNKLLSKTGKLIFGKVDDVTEAVAGKAYTKEEAAALEALGAQKDDVRMALQGLTKENGVDDYVYMLQGTFGNKAPEAIKQIQKVGSVLIARPTGEVAQEMGEELTSIYRQSDSFEAFKQEFSKRFPDADAMTQFVVASYVMGLGFGAGNYVGDVFISQSKKSFDQLPPDQQEIAAEAIREATEDINKADTETINEIELDEASRPKTKEEEEWSAKEGEIKQGIDSNTKRINELDGLKNQIYSNYNITDPKTEDISNISEEDARRLEILNSEIDKADKARIKDEIELELHNKNKPVVEQAPVNAIHAKDLKKEEAPVEKTQEQTEVDNLNDDEEYTFSYIGEDKIPPFLKGIAEKTKNKGTVKRGLFGKTENIQFYQVKATGKQIKDLYYAVQEPSTEEVLPRQQGATPETGGEPQGMGQDVQGQEATQEGQEVSQENELDPDLANIDPLIIAARNGDVDAQNTLNEYGLDWEQTTTYRFVGNSEVETLLSNNRVESKRFVDAGIDVTTSPKVTSASNSEYRITFKESFDVNNGLGKVKVKSREEGDHNLEKGRGYSLEDVAKIERLDENGNVVETLYDAKQKSLEGKQQATQEGVEQEVVDIKSMSSDELEKKQYEIEKSKDEKDKSLFNKIDKELENREWKSVMNAPLESIKAVLDSLIEKNKTMPNGFSAYIDNTEARKVKSIVDKYSGEVSLNESEKDFKDAFFGNPSSSYSDGLKLRESARAYMDQGGSFKELLKKISNEFVSDGFTEEDAAAVVKRKLDDVKRVNQEANQEGVTTLNQESFSEDVTPEQKAKVEEQNQKDEDESINEIYDFNDEIKSIGTKEQFKQFLRSLAPKAAFSRIAWHNTKKPELTPREGQYYTNTRKNAEDTYKQDNTFAAIVFGNAPKKASFDEVQQVDTKAVKGEGADIVVTDDLSPAIGADMNYREFVPTSADQVIPIGTKENIEAFKAFVEQQKAPEVQVAEEVATEDKSIIDAVETLANAEEAGGSEITKAQKEVAEKLGEEGKKLVEINRNFDKLAEDLGFIKTCIIE